MKRYIILTMLIIGFAGCEPLDEVPFSSLSVENLYKNEGDVDAAIFGAYSSLNAGVNDLWYYLATTGPGESSTTRFNGGNQLFLSGLNFNPGLAHGVWWSAFYQGINRANSVIANVGKAGLTPELEEQKIAEARFIRAFNYFNLVKWFGGVPLHLEATTDFTDESVKKPRASIEEVYAVIVEDLKYAESRLPAEWDASNRGRATSGAAKAFLGKVYLNMAGKPLEQQDKYQLAADKLMEVVNSGNYKLQENFADIFDISNEFNSEIIFARPNIRENGAGTVLTFMAGVPNSPFANRNGQYQFGFSLDFYNSFAENDSRRDVTLLYSYTDASGRSVTYNDPENPPLPFGGYQDPNGIGLGKYKDPLNDISALAHDNDIVFMRYADVLLMLAEALNGTGQSSEALIYLNKVRDRAGLEDITTTDQAELLEIIKQERKWELAGEFQEYPDLQRWGDIEESVPGNPASQRIGISYSPFMELLPIPQNQLDANENLVQNPGY